MPSHETQAGTLWPTFARTAPAYAQDERGCASRKGALQPGVEAARPGQRHHSGHSHISRAALHPAYARTGTADVRAQQQPNSWMVAFDPTLDVAIGCVVLDAGYGAAVAGPKVATAPEPLTPSRG